MKFTQIANSRLTTVVAAAAVVGVVGAGTAVAAAQIGSEGIKDNSIKTTDIKDGTLQKRDLTADNFSKFTKTANVVTASTPASAVPAYTGNRVVDVPAAPAANDARTPLVTFQLDKGSYLVEATTQFFHFGGGADPSDFGVVVISSNGTVLPGASFTSDIPAGGTNGAQTTTQQLLTVAADNTNITVHGSIRGDAAGQAGASVFATQVGFKS